MFKSLFVAVDSAEGDASVKKWNKREKKEKRYTESINKKMRKGTTIDITMILTDV